MEEWIGEFSLGERKKERKTESKGRGEHVVLHLPPFKALVRLERRIVAEVCLRLPAVF